LSADFRGTLVACIALLLTAAAPEPAAGTVQRVPSEQAMAILGHTVTDPDGKNIGHLVDVLVCAHGDPKRPVTLALTQDQIKAAPEYADVAKPAQVGIAPPAPPTSSQ
jgi:hypothetical protein